MTIAESSRAALGAISLTDQKTQLNEVFSVVLAAVRNGSQDISGREIVQAYEKQHIGARIDPGTVAARLNALVAAKRLVRLPNKTRPCTVTGRQIIPVTVPAQQDRMF